MSAYELGKHFPRITSLLKLAELFDSGLDYIMGMSDVRKPMSEKCLPADETNLLLMYRKLNARQKDMTAAYMKGISDLG